MKQQNHRDRSRESTRVMRQLAEAEHSNGKVMDPIVEQLRRCPEAFKVGAILGKAFDTLKYRQDEAADGERFLPPPGTILPPFA